MKIKDIVKELVTFDPELEVFIEDENEDFIIDQVVMDRWGRVCIVKGDRDD